MTTKTRIRLAALALLSIAIIVPVVAYGRSGGEPRSERQVDALVALTTGFTFQGRLTDGGSPANGVYDLNFYLYDALAGGSQVGPVQTLGDVAVTAGLFTVTLNFGDIFHGAQYFLDIQVRPGASAGAYTILSPREAISAVPNASFALESASATGLQGVNIATTAPANGDVLKFDGTKWTPAPSGGGSFSLPFAGSQSFAGGLLKITNTGTGATASAIVAESASTGFAAAALAGRITSTSPGANSAGVRGINEGTGGLGIGVWGSHEGSGYGVYGAAPGGRGIYGESNTGTGVYGSSTTGNGGFFASSSGAALEVSGPIKVSGATPAAFVHIATVSNISGTDTIIPTADTGTNPNAILIVTPLLGVANPYPIAVYWDLSNWRIKNTAGPGMVAGARFNILVINR